MISNLIESLNKTYDTASLLRFYKISLETSRVSRFPIRLLIKFPAGFHGRKSRKPHSEKMGNPFLDDFPELVKLDSRNCAEESVVTALYTLEKTGIDQYRDFVKNVLEDCTRPIQNPIKKNSLALFKRPQPKRKSKAGKKIKVLQNNVAFFGQLYSELVMVT